MGNKCKYNPWVEPKFPAYTSNKITVFNVTMETLKV